MNRLRELHDDIGRELITRGLGESVVFKRKKYPPVVIRQLIEAGKQLNTAGRTSTSWTDCKEILKDYGFSVSESSTVVGWDITL